MKDVKELTPLIDGDILVYRCGFAADGQVKRDLKEQYSDDTELKAAMDGLDYEAFALGNVKTTMREITSRFDNEYRLFLTGVGNYREQVATILPYKGNRDPDYKPKYYKQIKAYLRNVWNAEVVDGREADDALGCVQWAAKDRSTIIVSIDKDLDQIPGHHYNWVKDQFYDVSLTMANLMLFRQMLTGDRTDNIPGINQIGDVRAEKILAMHSYELDRVRDTVRNMYRDQYGDGWEQAYMEVGTLLWIQRVEGKECPFL